MLLVKIKDLSDVEDADQMLLAYKAALLASAKEDLEDFNQQTADADAPPDMNLYQFKELQLTQQDRAHWIANPSKSSDAKETVKFAQQKVNVRI